MVFPFSAVSLRVVAADAADCSLPLAVASQLTLLKRRVDHETRSPESKTDSRTSKAAHIANLEYRDRLVATLGIIYPTIDDDKSRALVVAYWDQPVLLLVTLDRGVQCHFQPNRGQARLAGCQRYVAPNAAYNAVISQPQSKVSRSGCAQGLGNDDRPPRAGAGRSQGAANRAATSSPSRTRASRL